MILVTLSALLVWLTGIPPTLIFWLGVLAAPVFVLLQILAVLFYLRLMPALQRKLLALDAHGLASYLQRNLRHAYHGVIDNSAFVALLAVVNVAVALLLLFNALLIPTSLWEWLAFFAFGSALFISYIAFDSSRIIWQMLDLLNKPL